MKKTVKNTKPIKVSLNWSNLIFNSCIDMKAYYDYHYIEKSKIEQPQTIIQFDESFIKELKNI